MNLITLHTVVRLEGKTVKTYAQGDTIVGVSEDETEELLAAGAVEVIEGSTPRAKAKSKPKDDEPKVDEASASGSDLI